MSVTTKATHAAAHATGATTLVATTLVVADILRRCFNSELE